MARIADDPVAQRAAIELLKSGHWYPSEIAQLCGVSRQVVEQWAARSAIDWRKTRERKLVAAYRHIMANVSHSERRAAARHRIAAKAARRADLR